MSNPPQPDLAHEFPILERMVFFNHAAVAPLPWRAAEALRQYAGEAAELGATAWPAWAVRMREARRRAAALLGAGEDEVGFAHNTTHGLMCVAHSLPWRAGDNVVTAAGEFPANVHPWRNLAGRGVALRAVGRRAGLRFSADDFAAAIDARTRLVAVSLVQYDSGFRMPIEALAGICRERGVLLCVDAIQGLGALPVSVDALGCDFLVADGHKWLLGPEGAGLLYVPRERLELLGPEMTGWAGRVRPWDYADYEQPLKPTAERFEEGSPNMAGIAALGASLGLLLEVGIADVWRRIEALTALIEEGARRLGFEVASPRAEGERSGIVALGRAGLDVEAAARALGERGVVVVARGGWLRVSPHFYNTPAQVERFLGALAELGRPTQP